MDKRPRGIHVAMPDHPISLAEIREMDRSDPLRDLRDRFLLPPGTAYFDGHSLGPLPRTAPARIGQLVDDAMEKVIDEAKHLTGDLGGKASTTQMGDAVAAAV